MRYYEFIIEYKTDITKNNYGQKILDKLGIQKKIAQGYLGDGDNDYENVALVVIADSTPLDQRDHANTDYENINQEMYDQKKDKIVSEIIEVLEGFDPTKNKQYTQQIIKWFLSDNLFAFPSIEDGMSTLRESLYYFQKLKARLPVMHTVNYRDIAQYTSAKNFMASVQHFRDEYGKKEELPKGDFQKIYERDGVVARWPKNQEAACYLGQGTQWCTAATQSSNMFDHYNDRGALIVIQLAEPIRFYGEPEYNWSPNDESWEDIVYQIRMEHGGDAEDVLKDIKADFLTWIRENKLMDYDDDLIDTLVTDRKEDDNEIEEFIDSNSGPTSEAIDRYKKDFRQNNPEEYENRIKNGYEYMNWVREYVKNFMEDAFVTYLITDIRANKEVEAEATELALKDLFMSDWANYQWMDGFTGLLYDYNVDLQGPETEDQDSKTSSKIQMHIVPTKDSFKIDSMMDEEDEVVPMTELSTPEDGDTALSRAWRNQGPDSLQDAIRRVSEYIERMQRAKRTNNL